MEARSARAPRWGRLIGNFTTKGLICQASAVTNQTFCCGLRLAGPYGCRFAECIITSIWDSERCLSWSYTARKRAPSKVAVSRFGYDTVVEPTAIWSSIQSRLKQVSSDIVQLGAIDVPSGTRSIVVRAFNWASIWCRYVRQSCISGPFVGFRNS